jgi:hypothetical protein
MSWDLRKASFFLASWDRPIRRELDECAQQFRLKLEHHVTKASRSPWLTSTITQHVPCRSLCRRRFIREAEELRASWTCQTFACSEKGLLSSLAELSKKLATAATVVTSVDFARRSNELRAIANAN